MHRTTGNALIIKEIRNGEVHQQADLHGHRKLDGHGDRRGPGNGDGDPGEEDHPAEDGPGRFRRALPGPLPRVRRGRAGDRRKAFPDPAQQRWHLGLPARGDFPGAPGRGLQGRVDREQAQRPGRGDRGRLHLALRDDQRREAQNHLREARGPERHLRILLRPQLLIKRTGRGAIPGQKGDKMATRAGIGMKQADGSVKAIYLNWDGYPGYAGAILGGWYKTSELIEALLALGNLCEIGETLESCVAYHRDRGERLVPASCFATVEEYETKGKADFGADYLYIYDAERWLVYGLYNDPDWNELNVVIGEEEK